MKHCSIHRTDFPVYIALKDLLSVSAYLQSLSRDDIKTLGMLLGLNFVTVANLYDGAIYTAAP